jgi:anti-sigma regulatory factor (Ser/Thr protein kinase)
LTSSGPGDIAGRSGDLLDVVFGWTDFAKLRRLVSRQCTAAGLTGARLDDFVLAVHEIAANVIVHAGAGGRLVLRRAANGLRCVVADTAAESMAPCPAPRRGELPEPGGGLAGRTEPIGATAGAGCGWRPRSPTS